MGKSDILRDDGFERSIYVSWQVAKDLFLHKDWSFDVEIEMANDKRTRQSTIRPRDKGKGVLKWTYFGRSFFVPPPSGKPITKLMHSDRDSIAPL